MKLDVNAVMEQERSRQLKRTRLVHRICDTRELLDEDGYPNKWASICIRIWPYTNPEGWLMFIKELWHLSSRGWKEIKNVPQQWNPDKTMTVFEVSTGGWSGNESLIADMQYNRILWSTTWYQSRRGGHYIFDVDNQNAEEVETKTNINTH